MTSMRTHGRVAKPATESAQLQRKPSTLHVSTPGDQYEHEADRVANAVTGGGSEHSFSISRLGGGQVQREDDGKPKTEEEKYQEAGKKFGEAFLATDLGKKLKEAALNDPLVKGATEAGTSFISTLPGKVVTGAAAAGAVAGLAAAHKELPVQIPEIPLDVLSPKLAGYSAKITYEGPVDKPTKAMITFTYKPPAAKQSASDSEKYRAETAKIAAEQAKFRAGLKYTPGSEADRQQKAEEAAQQEAIRQVTGFGKLPGQAAPRKSSLGFGSSFETPQPSTSGFKPKPISLLDEELKLKPLTEVPATENTEQTKENEGSVQRKADGDASVDAAPASVHDTIASPGQSLDVGTRGAMESRFGHDFSDVRVHTDTRAAESARSVHALAYTSGSDIAFAPGQYNPHSSTGRNLLAHELAHVVQQTGGAPTSMFVQRRSVFESIGIFFGLTEGTFDDPELDAYLKKITKDGKIEDSYDSDNKARAIVRRWKAGNRKFNLVAPQKVLLIKEMLSGPTLDDDEDCILDLLQFSDNADLRQIIGPSGVPLSELDDDIHGAEQKRLDTLVEARFKGGRAAVQGGKVEPQGRAKTGAPQFPYDWAVLKVKLEGEYSITELVAEISDFDPDERDQAMHDLTAARTARDREVTRLGEQIETESDATKKAELQSKRQEAGLTRTKIEGILHTLFKDIALSESKTAMLAKTSNPTAAQKAEILKALKPDVRVSTTGTPLPFVSVLPGETKSYEQKLREMMPAMVQGYWDSMVKDRGVAEHSDPTKVHTLKEMEDIGNVAKRETDAVFGRYYDPSAHPKLKADRPGARGNIHDLFADMDKAIRGMTGPQRRQMAKALLFYFFQSDDDVRKLNSDHNASPQFDSASRPTNDEAKALAKLADEFTSTADQVKKLNEIDRGWDASANPRTGDINIQVFKKETPDEDRAFLWDMFQTLIHEYMHTLVHDNYRRHADSFGRNSNENNTLMEGVDCVLSETVWTNIKARVTDPTLRAEIEGPTYSTLSPISVLPPSIRRYPSYDEAIKLITIVGPRNLYAAYFIGDVAKIGGP